MTLETQSGDANSAAHPPMAPGALPAGRSSWPTVIGVIAIVLGAGGALAGLIGAIMPVLTENMAVFHTSKFDYFAGMREWRAWLIAVNIITMLLGAALVLGGVMLMSRKPGARALLLAWAFAKCVTVVAASYVGYEINQAQWASMNASGATPPLMSNFMSIGSVLGVAFGIAWGWAMPVFMVIWLMRPAIRREVRGWSAAL